MPESPPALRAQPPPAGPALYVWFEGLIQGKRAPDRDGELRQIVSSIRNLGLLPDLEFDGARFSVLLDDKTLRGADLDITLRDNLVRHVQQLVDAAADPASVESTLRCTAVYQNNVIETLFGTVAGAVRGVSRGRAVQPEDRLHAPVEVTPSDALADFGKKRAAGIAVLFAVAFSMLVWQSGILDRVLSTNATEVEGQPGVFGNMLTVEVEPNWGNYRLVVRRGATFPISESEGDALRDRAETPAERAAVSAVLHGSTIYCQLLDAGDHALAFTKLELGTLLVHPDGNAVGTLPGRIRAHVVRLAIEPGVTPK